MKTNSNVNKNKQQPPSTNNLLKGKENHTNYNTVSNPNTSNLTSNSSIKDKDKNNTLHLPNSNSKEVTKKEKNPQLPNEESSERDEKYAQEKIIAKIIKKGFESLTLEELAVTLISPSFEEEYSQKTSQEWNKEYKARARDRLNNAKFNIQWNTQLSKPLQIPFGVLFELVEKGDIQRVTEYMRKNAQYNEELLFSVDKNKRSPLHIAAKNGHTNLTSVLLSRGYSVHMRDKFLRTALHTACQHGRATVADVLLKNNSELSVRDSVGRTCLHYASCANSVELITLLLGIEPDLVFSKDSYGRTPLHYVVWNSNPNAAEIARLLIKSRAEVDTLDEESMTPLHYAADAGKGWIIPLLLRNGANPFIRDGRTHRTALELSLTDHIREMIIVYSGKPYVVKSDDMEMMKLNGEKIDVDGFGIKNNDSEFKRGRQNSQPKIKNLSHSQRATQNNFNNTENLYNNEKINMNMNTFLFKTQNEKLLSFLKRIQEYGIKSMQHMSKPYIYSGSWIENVNNVEDLFKNLSSTSPTEAVIKVFNILYPFTEAMPQGDGEESDMASFFHIKTVAPASTSNSEQEIFHSNNKLAENKTEIIFLKEKIQSLENNISEFKAKEDLDKLLELNNRITKYETENSMLKISSEKLNGEVRKLSEAESKYKISLEQSKKSEGELKQEIARLKGINEENNKLLEKKNILQNFHAIEIKKIPVINNNLINEFNNLTLEEEKSVFVFIKKVEKDGIPLNNLLTQFDKDNDLHLFKNEMINLLEEINLPMEDRAAVLKLAGFHNNKKKLAIKNIFENFYNREENKNKQSNEVLFKIAYILHDNLIDIEKVFENLKFNEENNLTLSELTQGFNSLGINIPEIEIKILFKSLEQIDTQKLMCRDLIKNLQLRKNILDDIGDINKRIRFDRNNLNSNNLSSLRGEFKYKSIDEAQINDINEKVHDENDRIVGSRGTSLSDYNNYDRTEQNVTENNLNLDELEDNDDNDNKTLMEINEKEEAMNAINLNKQAIRDLNTNSSTKPVENCNINLDKNLHINSNNKLSNLSEKASNQDPTASKNEIVGKINKINKNKKINGEIKIQVKTVENILLPSSLFRPYSFVIGGSLKGLEAEFQSGEILTDNSKSVTFNWATRIMIRNQTLIELGSLLKLELKVINKKVPIMIGECLLNWTATLEEKNQDKFVVDDRFQILSKRMTTVGLIHVQIKFIPFGSVNSHYDRDGKKNITPNSMRGMMKISNTSINEDLNNKVIVDEKLPVYEVKKNINLKGELINIIDKDILSKKSDLYFSICDQNENTELFSTRDYFNSFGDLVQKLAYCFNFSSKINDENSRKINLILYLKEKAPIRNQDDMIIAQTKIVLDILNKNNFSISDKYKLEIMRKNYFAKNNRSNAKENEIIFFMKFSVDNGENSNREDKELNDVEDNIDPNDINNNNYNEEEKNENHISKMDRDNDNQEINLENDNELINYEEEY